MLEPEGPKSSGISSFKPKCFLWDGLSQAEWCNSTSHGTEWCKLQITRLCIIVDQKKSHEVSTREGIGGSFGYLDVGIRSFSDINRMFKVLYNGHIISNFKTFSVRKVAHKIPVRFSKAVYLPNIVTNNETILSKLITTYSNLIVGDSSGCPSCVCVGLGS